MGILRSLCTSYILPQKSTDFAFTTVQIYPIRSIEIFPYVVWEFIVANFLDFYHHYYQKFSPDSIVAICDCIRLLFGNSGETNVDVHRHYEWTHTY